MGCRSESCECYVGLKQKLRDARTADEIRYAQLWVEINLPKELEKRNHAEAKGACDVLNGEST
jgi:hypothetical protein